MASATAPKKIIFKKSKPKAPKEAKEAKGEKPAVDSTFVLRDLPISDLDRNFALPEIARKQTRARDPRPKDEGDDVQRVTTSLEKLGISTSRKEPLETICWGDHYRIQLFVNDGIRYELLPGVKRRCTWCHQYPPEGALMLAVPFKFVSSFVHEHVYAPECVNVVGGIRVEPSKTVVAEKAKKTDTKSVLKINYFKRDLTSKEEKRYDAKDPRVEKRCYFECTKPVCSFNCMESKGRELAQKDPRFRTVRMHISHLYQLIFGSLPGKIIPAAPFEVLEEYGGEHTVDEYRKNFKFISLTDTNQHYVRARQLLNPVSAIHVQSAQDA